MTNFVTFPGCGFACRPLGVCRPRAGPSHEPASSSEAPETRPATTTFQGDTGLWFVPTAEILGDRQWSASFYRRGTNYVQGFTNVGDFAGTFAFGLSDRAEIFGSLIFDTRIDRDLRPLFSTTRTSAASVDRYPFNNRGWTGDNLGDFSFGVKVNLMSEYRQQPVAVAVRAVVKTPTGDEDAGVSTGKADFAFDLIVSKETTGRSTSPPSAATSSAANPTTSIRRAARSAGARASDIRRAARCAASSS